MATTGIFQLQHAASVVVQPAAGIGGGRIGMGELLGRRAVQEYGWGTGAGRFNAAYYYNSRATGNTALLTTAARSLDLQTQVDQFNVALGLEEVVYFEFISDPDNTYNIEIKPNVANGFDGILKDPSDILKIKPGARFIYDAMRCSVGAVVDATHKVLDLANATSSTQHYELLIIGRNTS